VHACCWRASRASVDSFNRLSLPLRARALLCARPLLVPLTNQTTANRCRRSARPTVLTGGNSPTTARPPRPRQKPPTQRRGPRSERARRPKPRRQLPRRTVRMHLNPYVLHILCAPSVHFPVKDVIAWRFFVAAGTPDMLMPLFMLLMLLLLLLLLRLGISHVCAPYLSSVS